MKGITASQARDFVLCPRLVYLNLFGPSDERVPISEFLLKKMEEGREFERKVISGMKFVVPKYRHKDWKDAFEKTYRYMRAGEELIYQGVLLHSGLFGIPDLLERAKGKSELGSFHYRVVEIKSGLSAKEKYVMQVMFYSYILYLIQGVLPKKAYLILGDETRKEIDVMKHFEKFKQEISMLREVVSGREIEPSRIVNCSNCPWYDYCFRILKEKGDLSLLYRMSRQAKATLNEAGIKTLKQLVSSETESLPGISGYIMKKWKLHAESLISGKPIIVSRPGFPRGVDIFVDLESEDGTEYLIGVLAEGRVRQFVADTREEEGKAWNEFLDFISGFGDFVIYHYGDYEKRAFRKLAEKYGMPAKLRKKVFSSMFNLLSCFPFNVVLPVYSYSLKPVARFLGFSWRNPSASGDLSMVWYDSYLETRDKKYLNMVKEYNEDDLKATKVVKDWLSKGGCSA